MMAHTLGNPFDLEAVVLFCREHDLWLVEDNCDALGSTYFDFASKKDKIDNPPPMKFTGTFGDLSTQSFYPPHHITMGEGGAVNIVRDMKFKVLVESFRDWGRDCWCASGKGKHMQQTLRLATGRAAGRIRSQVYLLASRL